MLNRFINIPEKLKKYINKSKSFKNRFLSFITALSVMFSFFSMFSINVKSAPSSNDYWTDSGNYVTSWYDSAKNSFNINSASQLAGLAYLVNNGNTFSGKTIILKSNAIDLSAHYWIPIGTSTNVFKGTLDGQINIITNLKTDDVHPDFVGLIGRNDGGTVKNIGITNTTIKGDNSTGGIVGENAGTVENCYHSGSISGGDTTGGIVGSNKSGAIVKNCYNIGAVSGTNKVGGVIGINNGTVTNTYNTGVVSGINEIGGIIGLNNGTLTDAYNTGTISGTSTIGGVAGSNSGTIRYSYYTGCSIGIDGDATSQTGAIPFLPTSISITKGDVQQLTNVIFSHTYALGANFSVSYTSTNSYATIS